MTVTNSESGHPPDPRSSGASWDPGSGSAHFARTRAALEQYRLHQILDEERGSFRESEGGGLTGSTSPRVPVLLAVGGIALATLMAAYLPFSGGAEDAGAPGLTGKATLEEWAGARPLDRNAAFALETSGSSGSSVPASPPATAVAPQSADAPKSAQAVDQVQDEPPRPDPPAPSPVPDAAPPGPTPRAYASQDSSPTLVAAASPRPEPTAEGDRPARRPSVTAAAQHPAGPVFQLQLVSVSTEPAALRAWETYKQNFGGLLAKLEPAIESARVGARTVFRLRVGEFQSRSEGEKLCRELHEHGDIECFVVAASSVPESELQSSDGR